MNKYIFNKLCLYMYMYIKRNNIYVWNDTINWYREINVKGHVLHVPFTTIINFEKNWVLNVIIKRYQMGLNIVELWDVKC